MRLSQKTFLSLALFASPMAFAVKYLPLEQGNQWVYRAASGSGGFTIKVGSPAVLGGKVYYSLRGYATERIWVREDRNLGLVYFDEEADQERVLTPFQNDQWIDAPLRACKQQARAAGTGLGYEGPVGRFSDSLGVAYSSTQCADAGTVEEIFAANIGMLRRSENSLRGPVLYELVSARVGKQTITTNTGTGFDVGLVLETAATLSSVTVNFGLQVTTDTPLKLHYNSTQDFDVVLYDPDGTVIYRWSDGRVFTQQIREMEVFGPGPRYSVTIPLGVELPRPLKDGTYTVEAYLTSGPGRRQFAGAAQFSWKAQ